MNLNKDLFLPRFQLIFSFSIRNKINGLWMIIFRWNFFLFWLGYCSVNLLHENLEGFKIKGLRFSAGVTRDKKRFYWENRNETVFYKFEGIQFNGASGYDFRFGNCAGHRHAGLFQMGVKATG